MSVIKTKKHVKTCWVSNSRIENKPWGYERIWSALHGISGKILYIKAGHRNSLKHNTLKDECLFVLEGNIEVEYGSEHSLVDPVMHPFIHTRLEHGETLNIQSNCPYRIKALTDAQVIEIGTGYNNGSEVVRIEDDYGRK
jgi:mannose-6-phosphate isomerase-like protein (cupin superfamily)